ncbi:MAG: CAP domain-containing protein [Candidatus Paceibacterota bacterium]
MKILKFFLFFIILISISIFVSLVDFSFLILRSLEKNGTFGEFIIEAGKQVFLSSPLRINTEEIYFPLEISETINITNKHRQENGLPPLKENSKLNSSALIKNEDMCQNQYFEHDSLSNEGVGDLAKKTGYDFIFIGENLALGGFKSEEDLLSSWMNSQGHRENILSKNYSEVGISLLRCNFENKNVWLAVSHFGLPLSSCPIVNENLKTRIDFNKIELDNFLEKIETLYSEISGFEIKVGQEYIKKVREYNMLVSAYNILVKETEELADDYNKQIVLFNKCVDEFR